VNPLLWYLLLDIYKKRHQIKPVQAALREGKGKERKHYLSEEVDGFNKDGLF
jgi:hypothetical protein